MDPVLIPIVAIISVFVAGPIAIAVSRAIWKRANDTPASGSFATDNLERRMAELQQSMDTMAVEIERIAEGQRFVVRLMSERPAGELAAPPAKSPTTKRGQ